MFLTPWRGSIEDNRRADALLEKLGKKINVLGAKAVAEERRPEPHLSRVVFYVLLD